MRNPQRIAIADRSYLSHNIYEMLLKPLGYSLFCFKTLKELKENLDDKLGCLAFLINSNTFGNHFDRHFLWLEKDPMIREIHKIFLCQQGEKKFRLKLKKISNSRLIDKPFHPTELGKMLGKIFNGS